jgi:hypothetical protein
MGRTSGNVHRLAFGIAGGSIELFYKWIRSDASKKAAYLSVVPAHLSIALYLHARIRENERTFSPAKRTKNP